MCRTVSSDVEEKGRILTICPSKRPTVGIICSDQLIWNGQLSVKAVKAFDINAVQDHAGADVILIPRFQTTNSCPAYVMGLDGIVLTGGPSNIEPQHYGGPPFPSDELTDPERDHTVL